MVAGSLKAVVPRSIRTPVGQVIRACQAPFYYARARRILRDYTRHYQQAQRIFSNENKTPTPAASCLRDFGIRVVSVCDEGNLIDLPDNYLDLVSRVAADVKAKLYHSENCSFFPQLPAGTLPTNTDDIPAVKNGDVITIQLRNPLAIDGLEELCAPLVTQLERRVYGSYAMVDKVYAYRSPISRQSPQSSWLWHYDNHPHEVLKLMIYLNDVSEQSAPFQYLRSVKSLDPVLGSLSPLYGESRVSNSFVTGHLMNGFEIHKVIGPAGTLILFDNNIIHKGTIASETYRDVLTLQFRPVPHKHRPHVDPRWTGTFEHSPFNRNPSDVRPTTRRLRHFS